MADEFQLGNNKNWWDSTRYTRFGESAQTTSSSATLHSTSSFGWPNEMVDIKAAQSLPPSAVLESSPGAAAGAGGALTDPNLQMMGLGLSSQGMDWNNQPVFRDEKAENSSFRSMLQDGMSSNTYFHHQESVVPSSQDHWRQNLYASADNNTDDSSPKEYNKQLTHRRGFSLDQPYSDTEAVATSFPVDASATTAYRDQSMFEGGLLASDSHQQLQPSAYQTSYSSLNDSGELMMPRHPNNVSKFPQFIVKGSSPPKQQHTIGQLQFSNSTPFWNATEAAMNDVRSSYFPSLQTQLVRSTFDVKQKNTSAEIQNSGVAVKKSSSETSNKRPRNESSSPSPAFKVRKEKMGDRINALQQLVSPFGKTDTASVLSEAIEYIKILHDQVNQVLSTPYMRSGAPQQNQQHPDSKAKDTEAQKQDLRSRGLCLVPVSSTYPVTHETTVDFWTPTFGGTFR